MEKIKTFADGIGPEKTQLITYDNKTGTVKPSKFFNDARELGLFFHPYTFRIDSLPYYAADYNQLLKIFLDDLKIEGLFTDFSDLTMQYIKNSASGRRTSLCFLFFCGLVINFRRFF